MKKLIYLILIVATFSGCTKDNQNLFIDEISGDYNISSLTISKPDLVTDSITLFNAGEFVFEKCKIKEKEESQGFCPGYYVINNEPRFNFNYNMIKRSNSKMLQIQPTNSPIVNDIIVFNSYTFEEKTESRLVLKAIAAVGLQGKLYKIKMTLERK